MAETRKTSGFMVEELRKEREASALSLPELTEFIDGGEYPSQIRKRTCKLLIIKYLII